MEAEPQHIYWRAAELGGDTLVELGQGCVGGDDTPVPIDDKCRIRPMPLDHGQNRCFGGGKGGCSPNAGA